MTAPGHSDRWIATHVALHLVLEREIGQRVAFVIEPAGKPRVADWHGDFSLAHSGDFAVIAISMDSRVGVDVEVRRQVRMSDRRRELIEAAGEAVLSGAAASDGDADMRFLAAWTRLEAIAKLRGTGIGTVLEDVGIVARGPDSGAVRYAARRLIARETPPIVVMPINVGRPDTVAALAIQAETSVHPNIYDFGLELDRLAR